MYTVILKSDEHGKEKFTYETLQEALDGAGRLVISAKKAKKQDQIKRKVYLEFL